jgi:hypothetical protein
VGTTNVEGGFHALRQAMQILHGSYSVERFQMLSRLAVVALNAYAVEYDSSKKEKRSRQAPRQCALMRILYKLLADALVPNAAFKLSEFGVWLQGQIPPSSDVRRETDGTQSNVPDTGASDHDDFDVALDADGI